VEHWYENLLHNQNAFDSRPRCWAYVVVVISIPFHIAWLMPRRSIRSRSNRTTVNDPGVAPARFSLIDSRSLHISMAGDIEYRFIISELGWAPHRTAEEGQERLSKKLALPVFSAMDFVHSLSHRGDPARPDAGRIRGASLFVYISLAVAALLASWRFPICRPCTRTRVAAVLTLSAARIWGWRQGVAAASLMIDYV